MNILSIVLLIFLQTGIQDDTPIEPKENFEFELDFQFKTKVAPAGNNISFTPEPSSRSTSQLPYVKMNFDFERLPPQYYRVRITGNNNFSSKRKKLKRTAPLELDLGFAEDIKDEIVTNEYVIYFENKERVTLSCILIRIDSEGNFYLNNQLHGKF